MFIESLQNSVELEIEVQHHKACVGQDQPPLQNGTHSLPIKDLNEACDTHRLKLYSPGRRLYCRMWDMLPRAQVLELRTMS